MNQDHLSKRNLLSVKNKLCSDNAWSDSNFSHLVKPNTAQKTG